MNFTELTYLKKRQGFTLTVEKTTGNAFKKENWEKYYGRTQIENLTRYSWAKIISYVEPTPEISADVYDSEIDEHDKKIDYQSFEQKNFCKGIKQAFKTLENKGPFVTEEVVKKGNQINVPFIVEINKKEVRLLVVFHRQRDRLAIKIVEIEDHDPHVVVIIPNH